MHQSFTPPRTVQQVGLESGCNSSCHVSHKSKPRIRWIDALRGFSMFFVVYYHLQAIGIGVHVSQSILGSILLSFRMPVFFFVSGFIAYKALEYWTSSFFIERITNKIRVQLIPTFVFFSLAVLFYGGTNPLKVYLDNGLGGFWFTLVLFEFFVIYFTTSYLSKYFGSKVFNIIVGLLAFLSIAYFALHSHENKLWTILSLTPFLKYLQFFLLGVISRKYQSTLFNLLSKDWFITINIIAFTAFVHLICSSNDIKAEYGIVGNLINDELVRYCGLFIVLSCFYKNREYFAKENFLNKTLILMGRRSLDIYMIHNFILPHLPGIKSLFQDKSNIAIEFWVLVGLTILIVSFSVIIGSILRNSKFLGHYLLGAK